MYRSASRSNDEPLQPFTINPTLTQMALPRTTTEGEAQIFSANLGIVSRPTVDWRFSARLRRYDFNNETPQAVIPNFINYDTSVKASTTNGPELFAHARTTFDADATWSGLGRWRLLRVTRSTPTVTSTGSSRAATRVY